MTENITVGTAVLVRFRDGTQGVRTIRALDRGLIQIEDRHGITSTIRQADILEVVE